MKEDKDIFDQFREKDKTSKVRPSDQAWTKLSAKLDDFQAQDVPVVPLYKRWRFLSIAAAIALVVGLAAVIIPMTKEANMQSAAKMSEPMLIEDLAYSKPTGFYALAIKTNKYYNTSPKAIAQKESALKRLQIKDRKTRKAEDPSYLALRNTTVKDLKKMGAAKKADLNLDHRQTLADSLVVVFKESASIEADVAVAAGAEAEAVVNMQEVEKNVAVDRAFESVASSETMTDTPVTNSSKEYAKRKASTYAADEALNATANAMTFEADDANVANIDYFKWLIGDWETKNLYGQQNIQNWQQEDEFTLSGNAILTINDKSINVEKLMIKKIGDQLYFLRVNDQSGNTLTYRLKSFSDKEAVFYNVESGDEFSLKQQSKNKFENEFLPNGSLQLNQYPGNVKGLIEYKRID